MARLSERSTRRWDAIIAEREGRCLHCGHQVEKRPRGCKAGHCKNCGHPYPLGDCSD